MSQLSGKTEEELTEELAGVIFKNPIGEKWEPSDEYLSGNEMCIRDSPKKKAITDHLWGRWQKERF